MDNENDPFKDYYQAAFKKEQGGETVEDLLARMEADAAKMEKSQKVTADAKTLRVPINLFVRAMNALIGKVFDEENKKGTRTDLIVTLVFGGLAFTLANVFYMVKKSLKVELSFEEFKTSIIGMLETAMKDLKEKNDGEV